MGTFHCDSALNIHQQNTVNIFLMNLNQRNFVIDKPVYRISDIFISLFFSSSKSTLVTLRIMLKNIRFILYSFSYHESIPIYFHLLTMKIPFSSGSTVWHWNSKLRLEAEVKVPGR